ncbi:MAG: ThiF family adenylyltransferase [Myxococcota bacterium]
MRYRLKSSVQLIPLKGRVIVRDITDAAYSIDGELSVAFLRQIARHDGVDASVLKASERQLLDSLEKVGVVQIADAEAGAVPEHLDRVRSHYSRFGPRQSLGDVAVKRLQRAHVLCVGVGGLGSWTAQHLALSGVGRLTVLDGDRVERSNLGRIWIYGAESVGLAKVDVTAEEIGKRSATEVYTQNAYIESYDDALRAVSSDDFDLVVLTADKPAWLIAGWFARACAVRATPLLRGNSTFLGPMFVPGETACPQCAWPSVGNSLAGARDVVSLYRDSLQQGQNSGVLSSHIATSASLLATEALNFLAVPSSSRLRNAVLRTGIFHPQPYLRIDRLDRDTDCLACSNLNAASVDPIASSEGRESTL